MNWHQVLLILMCVFMIRGYWDFCAWLGSRDIKPIYGFIVVILSGFVVAGLMALFGSCLTS